MHKLTSFHSQFLFFTWCARFALCIVHQSRVVTKRPDRACNRFRRPLGAVMRHGTHARIRALTGRGDRSPCATEVPGGARGVGESEPSLSAVVATETGEALIFRL